MLILAPLSAVLAAVLAWLISRSVTVPIRRLRWLSREYARGHFSRRIGSTARDEMGEISRELDRLGETLRHDVVGLLRGVAAGDIHRALPEHDGEDELAPVLEELMDALRSLVEEINARSARAPTRSAFAAHTAR